jgi:hypothetical protein
MLVELLPAKPTLASVMLPSWDCLAGRSALPLDPGDGGRSGMPPGRRPFGPSEGSERGLGMGEDLPEARTWSPWPGRTSRLKPPAVGARLLMDFWTNPTTIQPIFAALMAGEWLMVAAKATSTARTRCQARQIAAAHTAAAPLQGGVGYWLEVLAVLANRERTRRDQRSSRSPKVLVAEAEEVGFERPPAPSQPVRPRPKTLSSTGGSGGAGRRSNSFCPAPSGAVREHRVRRRRQHDARYLTIAAVTEPPNQSYLHAIPIPKEVAA